MANQQRNDQLRQAAHAFCQTLLTPPDPADLISRFFAFNPRITEHGPSWANGRLPFLGKPFEGFDGCVEYFTLLSQTLKMHMNKATFPDINGFIVDTSSSVSPAPESKTRAGVVCVVGKAKFESVKTGKSWQEQFIYRLSEWDEKGKFGHWEIWADPLSAWEAVGGDSES